VRKLWIGIVGIASAMASAVLPSGAGQHFGVAGDFIAFPVASAAVAGAAGAHGEGPETSVQGFFAWGLAASATDDATSRTVRLDSFTGCLSVTTPQGSDFGCVHDLRLPPSLTDPAMREVAVQGSAPSERYPGALIDFNLHFVATGEPAPGERHSTSGNPALRIAFRAGLETTVIASGTVRSIVGDAIVDGMLGRYGRGVVIDSCQYETQPCPPPGS